jgi:hypothetical protein
VGRGGRATRNTGNPSRTTGSSGGDAPLNSRRRRPCGSASAECRRRPACRCSGRRGRPRPRMGKGRLALPACMTRRLAASDADNCAHAARPVRTRRGPPRRRDTAQRARLVPRLLPSSDSFERRPLDAASAQGVIVAARARAFDRANSLSSFPAVGRPSFSAARIALGGAGPGRRTARPVGDLNVRIARHHTVHALGALDAGQAGRRGARASRPPRGQARRSASRLLGARRTWGNEERGRPS